MEDKKNLTAKEARSIAESSEFLKNRIYKAIREAAKECHTAMVWDVENSSPVMIEKVMSALQEDGYTVKYTQEETTEFGINFGFLTIKW